MIENIIQFVIFLILAPILFMIWLSWTKICFNYWINLWAKKNNVKLVSHEPYWLNRGPYNFSLLFILPVFKIEAVGEKANESGWVDLTTTFFLGGKGRVIWDNVQPPPE